jgi:hypothetical protein
LNNIDPQVISQVKESIQPAKRFKASFSFKEGLSDKLMQELIYIAQHAKEFAAIHEGIKRLSAEQVMKQ